MNAIFRTFSSLYLSVHDEEKCKMQICNGQLAKHIYHPMSSRVNSTKIMRNDVFARRKQKEQMLIMLLYDVETAVSIFGIFIH